MRHYLFSIILLLSTGSLFAQKGTIRGTVTADESGETLIGVNIVVAGTTTGTITDLDGNFSLQLNPGSYDLQFSYITYQTTTVEGIEVKANDVTVLENVRLAQSSTELQQVVITAEQVRNNEVALMSIKKKSASIMDGISASKMRLTGDATAVDAAKRVTGVSIEGGKYIYVRGLGDRYSKTTLNGIDIPGLDPDRNSLQLDIFPTNLIDNMVVSKNFTAELPADFTGGLMNVETKAFPDKKILNVSASVGFNPSMHFNPDYLTYDGGNTDFLGFDDGTRALPARARDQVIPNPVDPRFSDQEINSFVRSFNPQLGAKRKTSFMDYNLGFTIGDQIDIKSRRDSNYVSNNSDPKLGYIFSLSYRSEYRYFDDVTYGEYQRFINPTIYELDPANLQTGELGERSVLLGALGGLAYKTDKNKYRLTVMRLQNGESRAGKFFIDNSGSAVGQSGYQAASDNLEYNERSMTNVLLNGTHVLKDSSWEIDWKLSGTLSTSDDPDIRKTAFTLSPVDTTFIAGAGGNPSRIWRALTEVSGVAKVDIVKSYKYRGNDAKLKFGANQLYKNRDYEILFYDIQFFGGQNWPNPDPSVVLDPDNIFPNSPNSIYYQSGNNNPNPNEYQSNVLNTAFYISNEMTLLPRLKTILGLRAENYVQRHTGRDIAFASGDVENGNNLDNEKVLDSFDLFPSVNFIYALTEEQNLRASYTRTIARPSFKEISFAQIIDPLTNRIFNGSLFPYPTWDGNLVETYINNIDLRWELFQDRGQLFSVSAFYKQFENPIELVRIPAAQTTTEFQPRNVGDGRLYGVELELRKSLDFISEGLSNWNVNGNVTFVYSEIDMTSIEFNARKTYEKEGQSIDDTRQMAGQAPYVVNAGIGYSNPEKGWQAGAFYNVMGPALQIVGTGLYPDVFSEPFHSLNASLSKNLGEEGNTSLTLRASNILNDRRESFFQSYEATEQPFTSFNPGIEFSIGVSHSF
jgi:outer membrane receptor protein involved in Fe transport